MVVRRLAPSAARGRLAHRSPGRGRRSPRARLRTLAGRRRRLRALSPHADVLDDGAPGCAGALTHAAASTARRPRGDPAPRRARAAARRRRRAAVRRVGLHIAKLASGRELLAGLVKSDRWLPDPAAEVSVALGGCGTAKSVGERAAETAEDPGGSAATIGGST